MNQKSVFRLCILLVLFSAICSEISGQANLEIVNNSTRKMTVKVMRNNSGISLLHRVVNINSYQSAKVYFQETGNYFTKTKAELTGKDPIFRKGEAFVVYNGSDGYSELKLTYTIEESNVTQASGGKQISKNEFERD